MAGLWEATFIFQFYFHADIISLLPSLVNIRRSEMLNFKEGDG